jgi:hypothetical protein
MPHSISDYKPVRICLFILLNDEISLKIGIKSTCRAINHETTICCQVDKFGFLWILMLTLFRSVESDLWSWISIWANRENLLTTIAYPRWVREHEEEIGSPGVRQWCMVAGFRRLISAAKSNIMWLSSCIPLWVLLLDAASGIIPRHNWTMIPTCSVIDLYQGSFHCCRGSATFNGRFLSL